MHLLFATSSAAAAPSRPPARHSLPASLAAKLWPRAQPLTIPCCCLCCCQVFEFYPDREVMHSKRRRNAEELGLEARDVSLFRWAGQQGSRRGQQGSRAAGQQGSSTARTAAGTHLACAAGRHLSASSSRRDFMHHPAQLLYKRPALHRADEILGEAQRCARLSGAAAR
jgi:hypothetical protein